MSRSSSLPSKATPFPPVTAVPWSRQSRYVPVPATVDTLFGRDQEIAEVVTALRSRASRLLVLTGPGGVGKTRLAIASAMVAEASFDDGVVFVALAPIRNPDLVAATIARAAGIRESGVQPTNIRLAEILANRDLLLVLDNFEHLLPASHLVSELLAACPTLTILMTSRTRPRLTGERDFPVEPLPLPRQQEPTSTCSRLQPITSPEHSDVGVDAIGQSPAVRLFVDRARAIDPSFRLTEENALAVAEICRRVDGLPLAIELAAARTQLLSPAALLARLDTRLPLLAGGPRDQPDRLQTVRQAIAWSYDLLPPDAQSVFQCLAVFVGGFGLDAAQEVCAASLDQVATLIDQSLLLKMSSDDEPRCIMLETIREYALDQLGASGAADETRGRHAAWCVALAERAQAALTGSASDAWLARLVADHDNLRAALAWAAEHGDAETGLRLGGALWWFWLTSGHLAEGRDRLRHAFATTGSEDVSPAVRAGALTGLGYLAVIQGDFAQASAPLDEALALHRRLADRAGEARLLQMLGVLAEYRDDDEQATIRYEESLALYRALGAPRPVAIMLENLADAAYRRGEMSRWKALASEALAIGRDAADATTSTMVLVGAAHVAIVRGEQTAAAALLAESLARAKESGYWIGWADTLGGCAAVAVATGQATTAARLLGAAITACEEIGTPRLLHHEQYRSTLAAVQRRLDEAEFAAAWAAGRVLTAEQVQTEVEAALHTASSTAIGAAASPAERLGLTPREREVLALLVAGQSDPQIGATLNISARTVESHVAAILAKLGQPSRTAAVAHAVRHDLV